MTHVAFCLFAGALRSTTIDTTIDAKIVVVVLVSVIGATKAPYGCRQLCAVSEKM